jgi:serine/threonine protein kinase
MFDEFAPTRLKDKYVIVERLGRGGMGIVYKALLMPVEKVVAVKIFSPVPGMFSPNQIDDLRRRFIVEGHVLARMKHPNVIELKDFDLHEEVLPFYTMDLLPTSLSRMIHEEDDSPAVTPVESGSVLKIALQLCEGLNYLHNNQVIHKDLKPANVLLDEFDTVKISDFGISNIGWLDVTVHGESFMSVQYCAPEQKTGGPIDHRLDLYSLGVTLYKMLTGIFPSFGIPSVHSQNEALDPRWDGILGKALAYRPEDRYQNALEMKADLLKLKESDAVKEMVRIPAGRFLFGRENVERHLPEYWIDRYPVTNRDYRAFVESQNVPKPAFWGDPHFNHDDQPVVGVSWEDAVRYARWAGKRLPTQEEWEKAARGEEGSPYSWGTEPPDEAKCNHGEILGATSAVGHYAENRSVYGCCDMTGNVWEWTADPEGNDPEVKVIKGGSWQTFPHQLNSGLRECARAAEKTNYIGFRCVKGSEGV